jgi:16S rRNA (cytidine1402-2'-O)-methyltransferase
MLYIVATPIGNLSDISYRAIEILKQADTILCEDTRHTQILLKHFDIQKPLKSYHKFNIAKQEEEILSDLKAGQNIALVCDAGTPGIADPSHELILSCQRENIPYTALPGPCAAVTALTLSGMDSTRFQFCGFIPKKESELKILLFEILHYPGTSICYETPHRLLSTLEEIHKLSPHTHLCVARELTKVYEECIRGNASDLLDHFTKNPPRGEIVLLFSKAEEEPSSLSPQEEVERLQNEYGLSLKDAIKMAAHARKVPKKEIYKLFHREGG